MFRPRQLRISLDGQILSATVCLWPPLPRPLNRLYRCISSQSPPHRSPVICPKTQIIWRQRPRISLTPHDPQCHPRLHRSTLVRLGRTVPVTLGSCRHRGHHSRLRRCRQHAVDAAVCYGVSSFLRRFHNRYEPISTQQFLRPRSRCSRLLCMWI